MIRVSTEMGVRLMREYGVINWPHFESHYFEWNDCGVVSITPLLDGHQIDMAISKGNRHKARCMVVDIINYIDGVIYAPILSGNQSVINLAKKMGFTFYANGLSTSGERLTIYKRG